MNLTTTTITSLVTAALALGCDGPRGDQGPPGPPGGVDPAAAPIDKAFAGIGGRDAIAGLTGYRITADGEQLISLESYLPEDDSRHTGTFTSETTTDVAGDRVRIDVHRMNDVFGVAPAYSEILDGDVGVIDGAESAFGFPGGDLPSDRWAAIRRERRLLDPQLILHDLAVGTLTATDAGWGLVDGVACHRLDVTDGDRPLSLLVDPHTGELAAVRTGENDFLFGDSTIEVEYYGWRTWDGAVKFPSDVLITLADQLVHVEHRSAVVTAAAIDDATFAFPAGAAPQHDATAAAAGERNHQLLQSFGALGVPLEGPQTTVDAHQLAPGVWHLRGSIYHSLVIEQASGVILVEAPLYEARAKAVLDWIAANIPGKPVTHVIATHHHRDHAGGLRTLVARGARVIAGADAEAFLAHAFRAPHTLQPDELSAAPVPAVIEPIAAAGSRVLPDPVRPVTIYAVATTHAADMVMVYLPGQRVLFESDMFNPGLGSNPFEAGDLLDAIEAHGLTVDTFAGGHGLDVGTMDGLHAAAHR